MSKLAILGGEPVCTELYPDWPVFDQRDIDAVTEVVRSGQWGGYPYPGPKSEEFARRFAEMQGGGHPVLMMNGTVTMEVAARAAGLGWGDEIIVPALTFQASAVAPMAAGLIPVIVDVDRENYCMDPSQVEAAITERTRAILPVHLGAQMADMDAIMSIAERHNLIVIEDCAHAPGAKWRGRGAGTIGHFGSFSLQSSKILTTGEGGVLLCRTADLAERAASIINCGRPTDAEGERYLLGTNYRLPELQAALGIVALERFPAQIREREEMLTYFEACASQVPGVRLLRHDERHTVRSFWMVGFAIDLEAFGGHREAVVAALGSEGIPMQKGYAPMNRYPLYNPLGSRLPVPSAFPEKFEMSKVRMPEAERSRRSDSLWLGESAFRAGRKGVDAIILALRKVQENRAELAAWVASL